MSALRYLFLVAAVMSLVAARTLGDDVVASQLPTYPLKTCLVSGEPLGSMGDAVDHVHEGRLVRLCCKGCLKEFDKDTAGHIARLDRAVVDAQKRGYPLTTCLVSGEALDEDAVDLVHGSRLVRLCCRMCQKEFRKDPAKVMGKLDEAYIQAQLASYPLDHCPVSGEALDDGAKNVLYGNRLVRLCCNGCRRDFAKDPQPFLARVDRAAKADNPGEHGRGEHGRDGEHEGDHDREGRHGHG